MKLLFLFNYNASGNTSRYCGVRFYHSRKAVTHLLHVTQTQGDRSFRSTYDDSNSAAVVLDGSRNLLNLESIDLADSKELKIGSGDDLKLFHDGSHSFVHHNGTGALKLKEGSADAVVIDSGVVNLNHSGTTKLSTASNGVSVAGDITSSGSVTIGTGGGYSAGSIFSDSNWGMIFRAKQASPANADFLFSDSTDTHIARLDQSYGLRIYEGGLAIDTTTVIDSSRNLTNIVNITQTGTYTNNTNNKNFITSGKEITDLNSAWQNGITTSKNVGIQPFRYQSSASNKPATGDNANWGLNIYSHAGSGSSYPYGIQFAGSNSDTKRLYVRGFSNGSAGSWLQVPVGGDVANPINLKVTGTMTANNGFKVDSTTVIDSSRNLTNIGTISSGIVTATNGFEADGIWTSNEQPTSDDAIFSGYGAIGNRGTFYVTNGGGNVQIGNGNTHNANPTAIFSTSVVNLGVSRALQMNGTTVITSARNLTNIGTISSGAITSSGDIRANGGDYFTNSGAAGNYRGYADRLGMSIVNGATYLYDAASSPVIALAAYTGNVHIYNELKMGNLSGTTVIDSSRNLVNIGTIASSASQAAQIVTITNNSSASGNYGAQGQEILMPNQVTSTIRDYLLWGTESGIKNAAHVDFYYAGDNSNNNYGSLGLHSQDGIINFYGGGNVRIGGGVSSNNTNPSEKLYVHGAIKAAGDILPSLNDTYDLGSTANAWKELHVEDIRFHNASGAVGGIGQYLTGGDIEILSDHNIVFKETDANAIKAVFGMNGPNFTFGQSSENTSYRVYVNGSIASTADVTAYASDERLKTNIVEIDSAIEKIKQLRGVTFDWQDDVEEKGFEPAAKHETGVIAQEVQKVIPDAVVPAPFDPKYWTVKHEKIIPLLIEAIKEQQKEIEQLKKHSHPAKDMCDMNGYEELVARIEKMEKNYGNN